MKKFFMVLLVVISVDLSAQIQITSSHMPSIGDTIRYSTSSSLSLDYTTTGTNFNWDFRTMNIVSQDIYKFQSLLSTPYSTLAFTGMPLGSIGYKVADSIGQGQAAIKNVYTFFEKNSSFWRAVGTGFTLSALPLPAGGVYSDKDEIYAFPLNYNDNDSTTFDVKTPIGNQFLTLGYFRQKGYRVNDVLGWGTISTPFGNSIPCLKIRSRIVEIDSLNISTLSLNVGFETSRVEYKWLSTSQKIPILEVIGTEVAGVFTPTSVRYRDNFRAAGPSPLTPRVKFDVDKSTGKAGIDSFNFINQTTPSIGNSYIWTITPNKGVRFLDSSNLKANAKVVFDSTGVFTVKLQATNFVGNDDSTATNMISITKDAQNSISKTNSDALILLYPNPSNSFVYFKNPEIIGMAFRIFDLQGKLVFETTITSDLRIDISKLNSGSYTALISNQDFIYYTQITKE